MTILYLAVSHLRHRFWTYLTFLLSSTFAVWLFSLYSVMLDHPQFQDAFRRPYLTGATAFVGFFTATLILQLHASHLSDSRTRIRQLLLQGMRPLQLILTLHLESGLLALAVLGLGIGLSAIFARLFFLALGLMADLSAPPTFVFPLGSVLRTCLLFGLSYLLCMLYTHWAIRRPAFTSRHHGETRFPAAPPQMASQLLLSIITLLFAYLSMLAIPYSANVTQTSLWAAFLLLTGTWLLFAQGLPALLARLRERKSTTLDGVDLITLSLLTRRLHRSGRLLLLSSLLITGVLGMTAFSLQRVVGGGGPAAAYALFLLGFIGLMVLLAVGSLLYLQLLDSTVQDRARAASLRRLGLGHRDLVEVFSAQSTLVFGLPALVGAANGFALLSTLLRTTGADSGWVWDSWVFLTYLLLHALLYLFARGHYLRLVVGQPEGSARVKLPADGILSLPRPRQRSSRTALYFQIGGLASLIGGVTFLAVLPVSIFLEKGGLSPGPFTFQNLAWISALGLILTQVALTRRIAPWLVRLVLYPGITGTVLMIFGSLPPFNTLAGALPIGVMLLSLGTSIVGLYHLITGGSSLPLRGLVALLSGLVMAGGAVLNLWHGGPIPLLLYVQFGLNWVWTGMHMLSPEEDGYGGDPDYDEPQRPGRAGDKLSGVLAVLAGVIFLLVMPGPGLAGMHLPEAMRMDGLALASLLLLGPLLYQRRLFSGWIWPAVLLPGLCGALLILRAVTPQATAQWPGVTAGLYLLGSSLLLHGLARLLASRSDRYLAEVALLIGGAATMPALLWQIPWEGAQLLLQLLFGMGWVMAGLLHWRGRPGARDAA